MLYLKYGIIMTFGKKCLDVKIYFCIFVKNLRYEHTTKTKKFKRVSRI
jgi:hypothetical protein